MQFEAELADAVYQPADPKDPRKGLSEDNPYTRVTDDAELAALGIDMEDLEPKDSKFRAGVFKDASGNAVIAYRGTHELIDWGHNFQQGTIGTSDYYSRAKEIGRFSSQAANAGKVKSVKFVGHSLGGGLASAAAHATGQPSTTFNAAGLHVFNRRWFKDAPAIDAVSVKGELLTTLQQNSPAFEAVGNPFQLEAAPTKSSALGQAFQDFMETGSPLFALKGYVVGAGKRALELHGMDSVSAALKKRHGRIQAHATDTNCRC